MSSRQKRFDAPSSNGKSADFESVNRGSSPRGASKINVDLYSNMSYIIY